MEDPVSDIQRVVRQLVDTAPGVQRDAVYRYYVDNAGFRHPLSYINPGNYSRTSILGLYQ
jgi:hypothetical protein